MMYLPHQRHSSIMRDRESLNQKEPWPFSFALRPFCSAKPAVVGRYLQAGYSQEKLAEIIECSTIFISYIERGVKSPGLDKLMKIANALDVSVDILLGKDLASYNTERLKDIEQQLKKLPEQEQLKILDMIDSIISIELLHHNKQKG